MWWYAYVLRLTLEVSTIWGVPPQSIIFLIKILLFINACFNILDKKIFKKKNILDKNKTCNLLYASNWSHEYNYTNRICQIKTSSMHFHNFSLCIMIPHYKKIMIFLFWFLHTKDIVYSFYWLFPSFFFFVCVS